MSKVVNIQNGYSLTMSADKQKSMSKIVNIKGMNDILPADSYQWIWLERVFNELLTNYGYSNIRTPIVESTQLFTRSIGEVTDIVEKEMYTFTDALNGDSLTLRPEGTAGTLRAVVEHNLLYNATQKLWYIGQMFRHERPQKGRYRQFHQLGVEALGIKDPILDAEIILLQHDLWQHLGLTGLELQINCLGNKDERALHRKQLISHFENSLTLLSDNEKDRLYKNPLRILDSKNPELAGVIASAPKLIEFLGADSLSHHEQWKKYLTTFNIPFVENPQLVRGLDYYNLSVFEWVSKDLGSQATVSAGGRYDPLITELGGGDNYGIGFAIGIERLLIILANQGKIPAAKSLDIFVAVVGEAQQLFAMQVANQVRSLGASVEQNFTITSLKSQLKKAANMNAKVCLIIGEEEVLSGKVLVKFMHEKLQIHIPVSELNSLLNNNFRRI